MKRLNTHQFYELGTILHPLSQFSGDKVTLGEILWPSLRASWALSKQMAEGGMFLQSSKRAAAALLRAIYNAGVPDDLDELQNVDSKVVLSSYQVSQITKALKDLETVMSNDLPGVPTYFVAPKGIYSTDELISHAENHIAEQLRKSLPDKAKTDICEAGKCLAFEVATGSGFHMWRAVESVMDKYYQSLTGKTFEEAKITRNWGQYIPALNKVGADKKITVFLDHIREEYRNPISHPEETLDLDEAFNLFGPALSVIGQMLKAIKTKEDEKAESYAAALGGLAGLKAPEATAQLPGVASEEEKTTE